MRSKVTTEFDVRQNLWFPSRSVNSYGPHNKNSEKYEQNTTLRYRSQHECYCRETGFMAWRDALNGNAFSGAIFGDVNSAVGTRAISLYA